MESVCPHCHAPFARERRYGPRCRDCHTQKRADYKRVNRFEMAFKDYVLKWKITSSARVVPDRALLDGAVPIKGKIFFWRGEPYIAAKYREEVKATL